MGPRVHIVFDTAKTHSQNLDDFLADLETRDAQFGALLRQLMPTLTGGVEDDVSRRQARDKFNVLVKQRLDELASQNEGRQ